MVSSAAHLRAPLRSLTAAIILMVGALALQPVAHAAVPSFTTIEGVLTSTGGGPAADGTYDMGFALFPTKQALKATWSEGPTKVVVKNGQFSHQLGSLKALDTKLLKGMNQAWVRITIGTGTALPPTRLGAVPFAMVASQLACTGCVSAQSLDNNSVSAAKVNFNYAGSTTKGGAAKDLACTGCVSVSEMKFDGNIDLAGNSFKAKNGTFTGDLVATNMVAVSLAGDGSKLTNIKIPPAECKSGLVMRGVAADGSFICVKGGGASSDGLSALSNGLLSNQFAEQTKGLAMVIPDATGADAAASLTVPDWGLVQALRIHVKLENSDLSKIRIRLFPPNDKKVGLLLCDPCGAADAKALDTVWPTKTKLKSGDLSKWVGKNAKGSWTLSVTDSAFCVVQKPGNKALCDLTKKTDGKVIDWDIQIDTLSTKKVAASAALLLTPQANAPVPCNPSNMGAMYFDTVAKAPRYCDGSVWKSLASNCGNSLLDAGEECDDGNANNTDGCSNVCSAWPGAFKTKPGSTCLSILNAWKNLGGAAKTGDYWIKTPKGQVLQVWCDMSTEGGGYTFFPVASGISTASSTANNTCKTYGLDIVYPRSKAHWTSMMAKYGSSYFKTVPGISKPSNGGSYTTCAMRDPKSYGSGCKDWRVPDGGRWWLRDSVYSEPNGDYTANCWLALQSFSPSSLTFNDGGCAYNTTKYVCSTNDKK